MEKGAQKKTEGFGRQVPPERGFVLIYFLQKGMPESEAERFYDHYTNKDWKNEERNPIQNWKTVASDWIWNKRYRVK